MLILTSDQVEYCDIFCQVSGQIRKLPGVTYHGRCFVRGESYSKNQLKLAINHTRQLLNDPSEMLVALIESSTGFTLCYWDNRVEQVKVQSSNNSDGKGEDLPDFSQPCYQFRGASYTPVQKNLELATEARSLTENQPIQKFRGASYSQPPIPQLKTENTAKRKFRGASY